jgi:transposase
MQHISIGIDVGASTHRVAICREGHVEAERQVLRISATRQGFAALDRWIAQHREDTIERVVVESSGHYWQPLASHLRAEGHPVAVVNPLAAKYFAKRRLERAKSDPADARTLAALGMVDRPDAAEPLAGAELREAARFAMRLVEEQSRICNRILRLVDLGFPELGEAFDDPTCKTAIAVLKIAPTARRAARREVHTLASANHGPGQRALGSKKAAAIHAAARQTVAVRELEEQVAFEMPLLIAQHELLERQIARAEERVAKLLDGELARRLRTIPGVGAASAAALIAEIGDITRFSRFDKLVAFAGVHAAERSSGKKGADPETSWRMAKTGSPYLRAALYRIAVVGLQHNQIIKAHYARKRAQGKAKMNALGHCMKKALAIVWGVWRSGRDFDPTANATA